MSDAADTDTTGPHAAGSPGLHTWALSRDHTGSLSIHRSPILELVERFGSPLHLVDGLALDRNATAALGAGCGVDVFSSYKTNPIPAVLRRLHSRGVGAEVISPYELWLAFELGVPGDRIIYNGPAKSVVSLKQAVAADVKLTNANSPGDLDRLERVAAEVGKVARCGLRISLPHMWGGQFGLVADSPETADCVDRAQRSTWLELTGLHAHSGFGLRDEAAVRHHAEMVLAAVARLAEHTGWVPGTIDFGGSLACPTVRPRGAPRRGASDGDDVSPVISIARAASVYAEMVADWSDVCGCAVPEVVIEPGRALTGDTQMLVATVLDVRRQNGNAPVVVLDVGVELAEPMRGEHHHIFLVDRPGDAPIQQRLVGPDVCEDDILVDRALLPPLMPGDRLAIMDTGAYFVPFSTASSRPRPAVVMIDGDETAVIRRAESGLQADEKD